jgi:glucose-1-phosphate thymidylyltransferase
LPVAGQPVLGHILDYLQRYGFTEFGVVLSPGQGELRRLAASGPEVKVTFIVQRQPRGIAHAVQTAAAFLGEEPFLVYLGDILTDENLAPALARFEQESPDALVAVRSVVNPRAFGVAELDGDQVTAVVEKPESPRSNLAIAGIYLFRSSVQEAIRGLKPGSRGEYEITDAVAALIASGRRVVAHAMTGWWQDIGTPEGILTANGLLLDKIQTDVAPGVGLGTAHIQGRVIIGPGTVLQNVRLRGPLLIGPNCHLQDAYLGPYTSVGEGARILGASLENSILLPGCRLDGPAVHLEDCLLGRGAVVEVKPGRTVTLLLGDDGRLQFPRDRR